MVKVKVTLEEATKAQRGGSRVINIINIKDWTF